jgi:hypothetical protein
VSSDFKIDNEHHSVPPHPFALIERLCTMLPSLPWLQLIDFGVFVPDAIGRGFQQWAIPPGFTGLMFHQQCATLDTQSFSFPLTSSNVVTRTVIF